MDAAVVGDVEGITDDSGDAVLGCGADGSVDRSTDNAGTEEVDAEETNGCADEIAGGDAIPAELGSLPSSLISSYE